MTILLTGGTGLTSSRLAALLKQQGTPAIIASRSGASVHDFPGVKFDWTDEATYGNSFAQASDITAIYIVVPALGLFKSMEAFLDYSIEKGVKRFILLSFSATVAAQYDHGAIHRYLIDKKVEYGVLCPTWFMENFSEQIHRDPVRSEGKFYTASGNGKVPMIASADIVACAARLLTDVPPRNRAYLILGPELLSYDEYAKILSEALGKEVTHVSLSKQQLLERFTGLGFPQDYAQLLAGNASDVAYGSEDRLSTAVKDITGREPISFKEFVAKNKAAWL